MNFEEMKASGNLPSPSGVALSVFQLTQKPDVSLSEIGHAVKADPVLSGKLIKYANTLKAGNRVIASIPDALNLLGMATTRQIALGFSILNGSRKGECGKFDYMRFWSKSLARAITAQLLCARTRDARPEECFIGALLCDVGSLALATLYPDAYSEAMAIEKEREAFSADRLELTVALLAEWMLPSLFGTIALHKGNPSTMPYPEDSREYRLCGMWHFADQLADAFVSGERAILGRMSQLIREAKRIGLEPDEFASLCNQAIQSWGEWSRILEVPGRDLPGFEEMMAALPAEAPMLPLRMVLAGGWELAEPLCAMGHMVLGAESGEEALQLVLQADPQAVLFCLPGGPAFSKALRELPSGRSVYLILVGESEEGMAAAFEAGADGAISWPSNPRTVAAHLLAAQRFVKMKKELSA